ncbi:MAG: hypothetical protein ACREOZ_02185 [Gloeomargaritales cyanobacterium]
MTVPTPPQPPVDPPVNNPPPVEQPKPANTTDYKTMYEKALADQESGKKTLSDAQKERDNFKNLIEKITGALNPDKPPDPEKLANDLKQRESALKEKNVELAVMRHGGEHANTLLDSRKFMNEVNGLDPDAKDFEEKLKALIETNKPKGPPVKSSGGADLTGGGNNSEKRQLSRADLKGMSPAEINKARNDGLLDDLMAGKAS